MKKLLFICSLVLAFVSCKPDEPAEPAKPAAKKRFLEKVVIRKFPYWNPATQSSWDYEEPEQNFPDYDPELLITFHPKNEAQRFWPVDINVDPNQLPKTYEMTTELSNKDWEFSLYDDDSNPDEIKWQPMKSWVINPGTASNPIVLSDGSEYNIEVYYLEK